MGVNHSMRKDQIEEVLTEFESTTTAIRGIEAKVSRVEGYVRTVEDRREYFAGQTEEATDLIDKMTSSMNESSDTFLSYFTETLDHFADLIELLEETVHDLQLMNAPKELQKELGPLLIPSVVLVIIITASNVLFGFLVANDDELTDELSLESVFGETNSEEGFNVLYLFFIFHVTLISLAILYLFFELCRKIYLDRSAAKRRRQEMSVYEIDLQEDESSDELEPEDLHASEDIEEMKEDVEENQKESVMLPEGALAGLASPTASRDCGTSSRHSRFSLTAVSSPRSLVNGNSDVPPPSPKTPRKDNATSPEQEPMSEVTKKSSHRSEKDSPISPSTAKSSKGNTPPTKTTTPKAHISGALRALGEQASQILDNKRKTETSPDGERQRGLSRLTGSKSRRHDQSNSMTEI